MKKLFVALMLLCATTVYAATPITIDTIVSGDDLTISWLNHFKDSCVNAINNADGGNITAGTIVYSAMEDNGNIVTFRDEAFSNFVYTGFLPTAPASGLVMTTPVGTAYVEGMRVVKSATAKTYTLSRDTYVDLSNNGVYAYSEVVQGANAPATAANSIRLFEVECDKYSNITTVTDLRVLGIQLSTAEDYQISGCDLLYTDSTRISVDTGVVYYGSTRKKKATQTGLDLTDASDYIGGVSDRAAFIFLYVYADKNGIMYLDAAAPNYADTSGNTTGRKHYYYDGTDYYRYIGQVSLDASQNIAPFVQQDTRVRYKVPDKITGDAVSKAKWGPAIHCHGVPPTAQEVVLGVAADGADTDRFVYLMGYPGSGTPDRGQGLGDENAGANHEIQGELSVETDSSQNISMYVPKEEQVDIFVKGYTYKR